MKKENPPPIDLSRLGIIKKRLNYTKIRCDLIIAGPREEQNMFLVSLLNDREEAEYYIPLDIETKRIELNSMKTKIEQALGIENSMEIV